MIKPNYKKLRNDQIAATNAGVILAEIRELYPTIPLKDMAAKIGRSESALLRWQRSGRARFKDLENLIAAYPPPLPNENEQKKSEIVQSVSIVVLAELFSLLDKAKAMADNLRIQTGVQGGV
jgi:hypothetical protein